jgi:Uma2 family endonuclease
MAQADPLKKVLSITQHFRKPAAQMLKYEILDGLFRMIPTVSIRHQMIALRIASVLLSHIEFHRLGRLLLAPCNVVLDKGIIVQPDIIFIRKERIGIIQERNVLGAPDLIVEIASQDSRNKKGIYSRYGVSELWIADSEEETVEVMQWSELGYGSMGVFGNEARIKSMVFPRIRTAARKIFEYC